MRGVNKKRKRHDNDAHTDSVLCRKALYQEDENTGSGITQVYWVEICPPQEINNKKNRRSAPSCKRRKVSTSVCVVMKQKQNGTKCATDDGNESTVTTVTPSSSPLPTTIQHINVAETPISTTTTTTILKEECCHRGSQREMMLDRREEMQFRILLRKLWDGSVRNVMKRSGKEWYQRTETDVGKRIRRLTREEAIDRVPTIATLRARAEWTTGCPYCGHALERRCGRLYKGSVDRIDVTKNWYQCPKTGDANYVLCCRACNLMRNDSSVEEFRRVLVQFAESKSGYVVTDGDRHEARRLVKEYETMVQTQSKWARRGYSTIIAARSPTDLVSGHHNDAENKNLWLQRNCFHQMFADYSRRRRKQQRPTTHKSTPSCNREWLQSGNDLKEMYIRQGGFQPGTNMRMIFWNPTENGPAGRHSSRLMMPSLDHIHAGRHDHRKSNLQLVCFGYNLMKSAFAEEIAANHMEWLRSQRMWLTHQLST